MQPWDNEATWCNEHLSPLVVCDGLPHTDVANSGVYDKGIFRTTDGPDPLVQEPKGKP
jgi:hypothetical protein